MSPSPPPCIIPTDKCVAVALYVPGGYHLRRVFNARLSCEKKKKNCLTEFVRTGRFILHAVRQTMQSLYFTDNNGIIKPHSFYFSFKSLYARRNIEHPLITAGEQYSLSSRIPLFSLIWLNAFITLSSFHVNLSRAFYANQPSLSHSIQSQLF